MSTRLIVCAVGFSLSLHAGCGESDTKQTAQSTPSAAPVAAPPTMPSVPPPSGGPPQTYMPPNAPASSTTSGPPQNYSPPTMQASTSSGGPPQGYIPPNVNGGSSSGEPPMAMPSLPTPPGINSGSSAGASPMAMPSLATPPGLNSGGSAGASATAMPSLPAPDAAGGSVRGASTASMPSLPAPGAAGGAQRGPATAGMPNLSAPQQVNQPGRMSGPPPGVAQANKAMDRSKRMSSAPPGVNNPSGAQAQNQRRMSQAPPGAANSNLEAERQGRMSGPPAEVQSGDANSGTSSADAAPVVSSDGTSSPEGVISGQDGQPTAGNDQTEQKPSLLGAAIRGLFGGGSNDAATSVEPQANIDATASPDLTAMPATDIPNFAGTPDGQPGQQAAADPNSPEGVVQRFIEGAKNNDSASLEEVISSNASGQLRVLRKGELKESVRERLQNSLDGVKVLGSKQMKGNKKAVVVQNGFGKQGNFIISQEGDKPVILEMNLPR